MEVFSSDRSLSLRRLSAAVEILTCVAVVAIGTLLFLLRCLTINGAAILCVGLLLTLIVLSWRHFAQGRHPCFLFLCTLTLLQGGRLVVYCLGFLRSPMRAGAFSEYAFDLGQNQAAIVLLCLALSALCIYSPCRWGYRFIPPPSLLPCRRYLSYLYLLLALTLPLQFYKSYTYYQYVQSHGGYVFFFVNHAAVASSIPLWVRVGSLVTLPVFLAVFVLESRRRRVYIVTLLYFATGVFTLLMGSRAGLFALVLVLWYLARLKSKRGSSVVTLVLLAIALIVAGDIIETLRENSGGLGQYRFAPMTFILLEGSSLDVTETAVQYRPLFAPYAFEYLFYELGNAFRPNDLGNYFRGKSLAFDVPVLLDRNSFNRGHGTGGSYIGEAYVLGGIVGVVLVSWLMGLGLHCLYRLSGHALFAIIVGLILPDILMMPRGNLLDWVSVCLKYLLLFTVLYAGWLLFGFFVWLKRTPRVHYGPAAPLGLG